MVVPGGAIIDLISQRLKRPMTLQGERLGGETRSRTGDFLDLAIARSTTELSRHTSCASILLVAKELPRTYVWVWSERRGSNPQPPGWRPGTLPVELPSLTSSSGCPRRILFTFNHRAQSTAAFIQTSTLQGFSHLRFGAWSYWQD